MQKLILPINDFRPTAGYKNANYKTKYKYTHYGLDCVSSVGSTKLYGLGDGTVIACGLDGTNGIYSGCGYVLVIVYKDCYNWFTQKSQDITVTYMHLMKQPSVKVGQKVTTDTLLGYYGKTGALVDGLHLHIQVDTDTKYPLYCQGLKNEGHKILKGGTVDSTCNPVQFLHRANDQTIHISSSQYYNAEEFNRIPKISNGYYVGTSTEILKDGFKSKSEATQYLDKVGVYEK